MGNNKQQEMAEAPNWMRSLYASGSFLLGGLVLWGVWWYYRDRIDGADFHWYYWIQPLLIVLAGLLCLSAAIGFLTSRRIASGMELLKSAFVVIPVILAVRLVIVAFMFLGKGIGWIKDGASFEGFSMGRSGLWVTIAIIGFIVVMKLLTKKNNE